MSTPPTTDREAEAATQLRWALAELLGWTELRVTRHGLLVGIDPAEGRPLLVPEWPTDWSAAGALMEQMARLGCSVSVQISLDDVGDMVSLVRVVDGANGFAPWRYPSVGRRMPEAIVIACRDALFARAQAGGA